MSLKRPYDDNDGAVAGENDPLLKRARQQPITFSNSSLAADVEVHIFSDIYHLHSTTLRTCSRFFDKSLSDAWWKPGNTHHGRQDGIQGVYRLVLDCENPLTSIVEVVPVV